MISNPRSEARFKVGGKRPRMLDMGDRGQHLRNGHRGLTRCRFAKAKESSASESSEERTDHGGQSNFGKLLMTLEPGHESFANRHKRQREEQVMSDSDDEDDSDTDDEDDSGTYEHEKNSLQSLDVSGEVDGEAVDFVKQNVEDVKDEDEASDDENSLDLEMNDKTDFYASENTSSFKVHFGHTLDESEIDNLAKRKLKFKWQVPAAGISMSKWAGTGRCPLKVDDRCSGYGLKQKVYMHWLGVFRTSSNDFHSSNRRQFFSLCNSYCDILHGNKKPFYLNGKVDDLNVTDAYIMHTLNHIYKTRDLVNRNNEKLAKQLQNSEESSQTTDELLDQGFTRPKVLILLPLRSIALKVVKRLIELTPPSQKVNVEHMDRLFDEFGSEEEDEEYTKVHNNENAKSHKSSKPVDFQALFGGNNDDHFLVGIKFTRKSIRLYSDFYSLDMIIASPFGLITKIGEAESDKEKDVDYLSSIEVLIIDHADVIAMQNWSHLNTVVEQLNRIPSKQHGTDIMRIRKWYLDGNARFYRQTILLGGFVNPGMNALFNHLCVNYEGKVKLISKHKGVLPKVLLQVRQVYDRIDSASTDADAIRFNYFSNKVFPKIKDSDKGGIMLFISSYFEFVRIRNFLKSHNASFCTISEYTKQKDISRQRNWFLDGRRKIMLYTERAHFYFRYKIRGIKNLIIYSLPERKECYPEMVNMLSLPKKDNTLEGNDGMTCTVLFSRFDFLRLERIVGTPAANKMLISKKNTFVFC